MISDQLTSFAELKVPKLISRFGSNFLVKYMNASFDIEDSKRRKILKVDLVRSFNLRDSFLQTERNITI